MIREEGKRETMKTRLGSRAVKYEKRLKKEEAVYWRGNAGRKLRGKGKRVSRVGRNKGRFYIERERGFGEIGKEKQGRRGRNKKAKEKGFGDTNAGKV